MFFLSEGYNRATSNFLPKKRKDSFIMFIFFHFPLFLQMIENFLEFLNVVLCSSLSIYIFNNNYFC